MTRPHESLGLERLVRAEDALPKRQSPSSDLHCRDSHRHAAAVPSPHDVAPHFRLGFRENDRFVAPAHPNRQHHTPACSGHIDQCVERRGDNRAVFFDHARVLQNSVDLAILVTGISMSILNQYELF